LGRRQARPAFAVPGFRPPLACKPASGNVLLEARPGRWLGLNGARQDLCISVEQGRRGRSRGRRRSTYSISSCRPPSAMRQLLTVVRDERKCIRAERQRRVVTYFGRQPMRRSEWRSFGFEIVNLSTSRHCITWREKVLIAGFDELRARAPKIIQSARARVGA